jgi:hypothetical protein
MKDKIKILSVVSLSVIIVLACGWYFLSKDRSNSRKNAEAKPDVSEANSVKSIVHTPTEVNTRHESQQSEHPSVTQKKLQSGIESRVQPNLAQTHVLTPSPSPIPPQKEASKNSVIADGCFTLTYSHKKLSSHSDGEACLKHNNILSLNLPADSEFSGRINPNSVCILINGSAVKHTRFEGGLNQVLVGPLAGPNAKITARFCIGKATCTEKCVPRKDGFLEALGIDDSDAVSSVGWDGSTTVSKEDTDLESAVSELEHTKEGLDSKNKDFAGWIPEGLTSACSTSAKSDSHVSQISFGRKE